MRCLRSIVTFVVVILLAVHAAPAPVAGESTFTADRYVESVTGNLPIVLTAPHGGALKPDSITNRKEGVLGADLNSLELARALAAELFARTGRHPALVASHLHRSKLDPNREIKEAAQGDPSAEFAWREFHAAIRAALDATIARHGFAFLIDLHGHAHPIARLELGYGLDSAQLNRSDATFDASGLITLSTLRDLHARSGPALTPSALIRGPRSLGALYQAAGLRAIPSPQEPQPDANPFFAGGYIVRTYAAAPDTPKVDGLQIETYRAGVRDTAENRARFARLTVDVLTPFLIEHYAFDLTKSK
jgi:N-formylglutamate amidohydrolase